MKGYYTSAGYYGLVNGRYMLFSTDQDYRDYISKEEFT